MSAALVVAAALVSAVSGVPGLFLRRGTPTGERIAAAGLCIAAGMGLAGVAQVVMAGAPSELSLPWAVPGGTLFVRLDGLAAVFLAPIFGVGALGAVYGLEYWPEASHPENGRRLRLVYGLIVAGLAVTALAANAVLFLAAWEVMALSAFVAVATEDHLPEARAASYLYLITTRAGTLCLFAMFALIHRATGSFSLRPLEGLSPAMANAIFLLALVGFGIKAGIMPLHVWLPGAHAASPSHVSALLSGVLIKIGIYGLVRILSLLPSPPLWWALLLLALGATSGVLGVAFAIGQHDLKRLLAYHSIENIGIIVLGLGVAVLGRATERPELAVLGLAGALLHVWNHGLFKGLLFLSAGAVVHACGTREIDRLGGLGRRMPRTAALFLVGAVAISGLPPLNGFVSELLVYLGFFRAAGAASATVYVAAALGAAALALIGGLAGACFVKAFGAVFLGHPRSQAGAAAHEGGAFLIAPMGVLAALCAVIGLFPWVVTRVLDGAAAAFGVGSAGPSVAALAPFTALGLSGALLLACAWGCAAVLLNRLQRSTVGTSPTWDCGYSAPSADMQYTSSSFAQMLVGLFSWALWPKVERQPVTDLFPRSSHFETHVNDTVLDRVLHPSVGAVSRGFAPLRRLQSGALQLYIVYVVAALIVGLAWAWGAKP